jgi:OmcA/MtrC family decaheme c-type cytochrome
MKYLPSARVFFWIFMGVLLVGATTQTYKSLNYSKFSKKHYLSAKKLDFIRPGLNVEVMDLSVVDPTVSVTLKIVDDLGAPLDVNGVQTPGPISASFLLGVIPQGETQYVSYINRTVTSSITGDTAVQPTSESGPLVMLEDGIYQYTLSTQLPDDDDPDATHTVGMYLRRDLRDYDLGREAVNEIVHFTPSGVEVPYVRDVVRTESCNKCHDDLALHGEARKQVDLCVMCHTAGVVDPDTGNSVDLDVMVHKIHMGKELPSVHAGTPYQIIGFRNSVHDYSDVGFPQDIRNCESCHSVDAAQGDSYLFEPNRESCGSCHDDVNFVTGENHKDLPQLTDNLCGNCHIPQGELEFDASILGAHTIPAKSMQLAGLNINLMSISDTAPGEFPTVTFNLTNNADEPVNPADLDFFNLLIAGPNTDFSFVNSEAAAADSVEVEGGYSYTMKNPIPMDATGSFTLGAEAYRNVLLNEGTTRETSFRETAENPRMPFAVTDENPVPRRMVVADQSCDNCHENLALHGTIRKDPNYCVMCHQPGADDSPFRPEDALPARTIDFKYMVHRIHKGEELAQDYTLIGFRGTPHNYNEVLYPGKLNNCETCHINDSYQVPSPGILPTIEPVEYFSPIPANSAACLSCHDSLDAAAHAWINTAPFGESCGVCHGEGMAYDVAKVHAAP